MICEAAEEAFLTLTWKINWEFLHDKDKEKRVNMINSLFYYCFILFLLYLFMFIETFFCHHQCLSFLSLQEKEINKYHSDVLPKYLRNFEKQAGEKGHFVGDEVSSWRFHLYLFKSNARYPLKFIVIDFYILVDLRWYRILRVRN